MTRSRLPMITTMLLLAFFYLPLLIMAVFSFNESRYGGSWTGFSLRWYRQLMEDRNILNALRNTMIIALTATLASTVLGTLAAFALHRYQTRVQALHHMLIYTPLVVPDILMGLSLLLFFVALKLQLGLFTIFLAHVTFCISYVALVVLGRLQNFDFAVMEAARDLGASGFTAVRKVLLPLLAPGILAGALLAFTLSLDDFVITFFVSGPGSTTLPIYIYSLMRHGAPTLINALSLILLIITFVIVFISQRLLGERK